MLIKAKFQRSDVLHVLCLHIGWVADNYIEAYSLKVIRIDDNTILVLHHITVNNAIAPDNIVIKTRKNRMNVRYRVDILVFEKFKQQPELSCLYSVIIFIHAIDTGSKYLFLVCES